MVHAKNYETKSTFIEDYAEKSVASFFSDTVYNISNQMVT